VTPAEASAEMRRLSHLIDAGISATVEQVAAAAQAEADYRKLAAVEWVQVRREHDGERRLAAEVEAEVKSRTADARYARDIAEGMLRNARDAVRARQAQLSAVQSLMNMHRAEAEFVRGGS
jgi:hypothetical protein